MRAERPTAGLERPEHTEGYDGFYHCIALNGTVDQAQISYIVRDHDSARFEARKNYMQECVDLLVRKYGEGVLTLTLKDSYYNMRKMVEPHPQVIDKAIEAMKMAGVEPLVKPIRAARTAHGSPSWDSPAPTSSPAA